MDSYSLPTSKLIRVAAFEIRVADESQYRALVNIYSAILNSSDPVPIAEGFSFENGDKELRIVKSPLINESNRIIIYWQVKGTDEGDIKSIYNKLDRTSDYTGVSEPHIDGTLADNEGNKTESCILKDKGENQFGLIINPPYPRSKNNDSSGGGIFGNESIPLGTIIGLVGIGVLGGLLIILLVNKLRSKPTALRS